MRFYVITVTHAKGIAFDYGFEKFLDAQQFSQMARAKGFAADMKTLTIHDIAVNMIAFDSINSAINASSEAAQ